MRACGEQRLDFLGEALDAGAAGGEAVGLLALAGRRPGALFDVAAVMADERLAEAVLDQPGRAVRALEAMAAGAAQGQRRIAAPVEEQQRLFAAARGPPRCPATSRGASQRPRGGPSRLRSIAVRSGSARSPKRAASLSQR